MRASRQLAIKRLHKCEHCNDLVASFQVNRPKLSYKSHEQPASLSNYRKYMNK